ncbi:hypothetical protein D3C85_15660 [compost metagenome]
MTYKAINYEQTIAELKLAADTLLDNGAGVLFNTNCRKKLFQRYLFTIATVAMERGATDVEAGALRQHYNCSHCHNFMERIGHIVHFVKRGAFATAESVLWNPDVVTDGFMREVVKRMKECVETARITQPVVAGQSHYNCVQYTNNGGKEFGHFHLNPHLLIHRQLVLKTRLLNLHIPGFINKSATLFRLVDEVKIPAISHLKTMFTSRKLRHPIAGGEKVLERLLQLYLEIAAIKMSPLYNTAVNDYARETIEHNLIWHYASTYPELVNLRSSILGDALLRVQSSLNILQRVDDERIIAFWGEKTNGINYRRAKRPATQSQVEKTTEFLKENGYIESMQQVHVSAEDLPKCWVPKPARKGNVEDVPNDFLKFAAMDNKQVTAGRVAPITIDAGEFFNTALQYVESMVLLATGLSFKPIQYNRQVDMAKPVFLWDKEGARCGYVAWLFNSPYRINQLIEDNSIVKHGEVRVPVIGITSTAVVGNLLKEERPDIQLLLGGLRVPDHPRPALFPTAMVSELYEHRRVLEDYSRSTVLEECKGTPAITISIGKYDGGPRGNGSSIRLIAKLNPIGAAVYGHDEVCFMIDASAYHVDLDTDKLVQTTEPAIEVQAEQPPVSTAEMARP